MTSWCTVSLLAFTYAMKSRMPPSYMKSARSPSARSSMSSMRSPRFRNAISRSRWLSVSKLKSVSSKMSPSGKNVIVVPVSAPVRRSPFSSCVFGSPRSKCWRQTWPSRRTSSSSDSDSAFTTEMPTPCRPPETL